MLKGKAERFNFHLDWPSRRAAPSNITTALLRTLYIGPWMHE